MNSQPDFLPMSGERVIEIRRGLDLTRNELGHWLRLSPAHAHQTITDWEIGRTSPSGPVTTLLEAFSEGVVPAHVRGGAMDKAAKKPLAGFTWPR